MKNYLYIYAAITLLGLLCSSCQKEGKELKPAPVSVTIKAYFASQKTRVSYQEDSESHNLTPSWNVGDVIIGITDEGGKLEYKIASEKDIDENGMATFTRVEGSSKLYEWNKIGMIYAPGMHLSDIGDCRLEVSIAHQDQNALPTLMMAQSDIIGKTVELCFNSQTAIIGIKQPTFTNGGNKHIESMSLSASNVITKAVFDFDGTGNLQMLPKTENSTITTTCDFTTDESGKTPANNVTYFAVLPNASAADLTFSTNEGFSFSKKGKIFEAGHYYYMSPTFIEP